MTKSNFNPARRLATGLRHGVIALWMTVTMGAASAQNTETVSQWPLSVGKVPGNLLLVPSVEWPTLDSMANLGAYDVARPYVGYFDARKCYKYSYHATETLRHFYPVGAADNHTCSSSQQQWSGNYLNWAATQTIDPFRKALTGGYRVRDTDTETWLEKARFDGNGGAGTYPNRRIPASGNGRNMVQGATPANWSSLTVRIWGLGHRMRFTGTGNITTDPATDYNPTTQTTLAEGTVYEVSVRVKVCDESVGVEDNCTDYTPGSKPEGLIQQYSERLRYSVFGYLNDDNMLRDGGVLRARQKFVGRRKLDPSSGWVANASREWDPTTGVLVRNPDASDASATAQRVGQTSDGRTIADSGVINYINKFGQMTTANHKSFDPVSELYYAAIRYLKQQGNIPEYTTLAGSADEKYRFADGFPVITEWDDPIQYRCQSNALLGIGDTNTWRDKNLPGNQDGARSEEPGMPSAVSADRTVNVVTATAKIAELEGITISTPLPGGRQSSAFIAGLAYDSHTRDLRPTLDGVQTAATYWVDVRENQTLAGRTTNPYWLATKYGGFIVPQDYDPYTNTTPLEASSWTSGDLLAADYPRPANFYVASEADKMVESLSRAFANIAGASRGSGTALAANSTRLDEETQTFQAQFNAGPWSGELQAFRVLTNGSLEAAPRWRASAELARKTWSERNIYVHNPSGGNNNRYGAFLWSNLSSAQQTALVSQDVVNYLRGDRSREEARSDGSLRTRASVLGDIVNSSPVYVGQPNPRLYAAASFDGASAYDDFASAQSSRTGVVYVGANDGMLHGFHAETGEELYAFVPNAAIMNNLHSYTQPAYDHRYFVDGELTVADVYDTGDNEWKTILVGTLGRGGPGVFALDVTNPNAVEFLWEKNGTQIPALGKNIGRPVVAQVADAEWRVLLGNGLETAAGAAQLVMIDVLDGSVTTASTAVTGNNALTAVLARDSDRDGFADTAYAGDLRGNLWKFTGLSGTPSASKMFEARDPNGAEQPITAAPLAGRDPQTGIVWVFFGTGRYLGGNDPLDRQVQTWYGVKDTNGVAGRGDLIQRDILAEGTINNTPVRVVEEGAAAELQGRRGWYMDLLSPVNGAQGERMVVPNRFQGRVLIGTTRIPDSRDACRPAGTGYVMAINPFTGARLDLTFFDVTHDGEFNNADMLVQGDGLSIVSGIGFGSGPSNPIFIENVMQVGLDDGTTATIETQGSNAEAARMSWRELVN